MSIGVKVGGAWKDVNAAHVRVSGAWKPVAQAYVRVSGAWEELLSSGPVFDISYIERRETSGLSSSANFTGVSFGAVAPGGESRYIVVTVSATRDGAGSRSINAVSVGGISATKVVEANQSGAVCAIFVALVPTGTSGSVDVSLSANCDNCGIGVYRMTNPVSASAYDTGSGLGNPSDCSCDVPSGGGVIAVSATRAGSTTTWAGVSEDYDDLLQPGDDNYHSGGHGFAAGTPLTISATGAGSPGHKCACAASWAPT